MKEKFLNFVGDAVLKIKSFFKRSLPVGLTEFNAWANEVIRLAKAPANDSSKFAIASIILTLEKECDKISQSRFIKILRKSMANQVASHVMWELKEKQKAEEAAAKIAATAAQQTAEATASTQAAASNGSTQ